MIPSDIQQGGTMAAHARQVCKRINSSAEFHTKSWSHRFECEECGKSRRYNDNFLGSRYRLVCDGVAIKRIHRDEIKETTMVVGTRGAVEVPVRAFE